MFSTSKLQSKICEIFYLLGSKLFVVMKDLLTELVDKLIKDQIELKIDIVRVELSYYFMLLHSYRIYEYIHCTYITYITNKYTERCTRT